MDNALIIFIKNPIKGTVKTRLAATIGNDKALEIYKKLILHTLNIVQNLNGDKYIFFSESIDETIGQPLNFFKAIQNGNDLGEKMQNAFVYLFTKNYKNVGIIGTDCPGITLTLFEDAFTKLKSNNVVIGPALDGGYYFIGMNTLQIDLFNNIAWSTANVLNDTITKCNTTNLTYTLLTPLSDIDEEKDLIHFKTN